MGLSVAQNYLNTATADFNDDVAESNEADNVTTDAYTVIDAVDGLFVTVVTLPRFGTLFDQTGAEITEVGAVPGTQVTYVPDETDLDFFEYTVTNTASGLTSVIGRVDLSIAALLDPCALVGRPPECEAG